MPTYTPQEAMPVIIKKVHDMPKGRETNPQLLAAKTADEFKAIVAADSVPPAQGNTGTIKKQTVLAI